MSCHVHIYFVIGPVHTYPDSFVSANILLRIQKFTRPHVCGFVAFSSVHTYPPKRYEYARFAYRACAITCDESAMLLVIANTVFPHCRKFPICRKFYRKKEKFRMKEIRRKSMKPQEKRVIFIYSPTHVSSVWPDCEQSS